MSVIVFLLAGCLGDRFTLSENAPLSIDADRICFTVLKPDDYSLSYFDLFERGNRNSVKHPEIAEYKTDNSLLLCLAEDTVSDSEIVYVAQFGLTTQTKRKPIRKFSVAFNAEKTGFISVPLLQNEISYYMGRGY
ncbi:putative T6SS immunity periplasmic lipoprotein [Pantoea sp. ME81]|uniref:putative T6SS immunity periplasmic lipoprotein n=1 Tax=Pantoea sp. ME81 TaxID=2743935 RepID=UPI0015F42333|nr:putative T6SS immunity periplasmic lipoprotein [Pantoea sp. ME81]